MTNQCAECGGPAPRTLLCDGCRIEYDRPFVDDTCQCPSCRSDCAGIVPCVAGEGKDR